MRWALRRRWTRASAPRSSVRPRAEAVGARGEHGLREMGRRRCGLQQSKTTRSSSQRSRRASASLPARLRWAALPARRARRPACPAHRTVSPMPRPRRPPVGRHVATRLAQVIGGRCGGVRSTARPAAWLVLRQWQTASPSASAASAGSLDRVRRGSTATCALSARLLPVTSFIRLGVCSATGRPRRAAQTMATHWPAVPMTVRTLCWLNTRSTATARARARRARPRSALDADQLGADAGTREVRTTRRRPGSAAARQPSRHPARSGSAWIDPEHAHAVPPSPDVRGARPTLDTHRPNTVRKTRYRRAPMPCATRPRRPAPPEGKFAIRDRWKVASLSLTCRYPRAPPGESSEGRGGAAVRGVDACPLADGLMISSDMS
jgi:hypothetical protein